MSVIQQLRDSGLFDEYPRPKSGGNIRFKITGWDDATIWASDREIHVGKKAFEVGRFRNINDRLHKYVCTHSHGIYRPSNPAYKLSGEYIQGLIEIIADGMRGPSSI